MPKRRRLFSTKKYKPVSTPAILEKGAVTPQPTTPRGRLQGALLEALDPVEESDTSLEYTPFKRYRSIRIANRELRKVQRYSSEDDQSQHRHRSPPRQSYVLKLFDRSVDLSQFEENSPLYPICRAWITNQPKADYSSFGRRYEEPCDSEESVELPGPEGEPISRIPPLTPAQLARNTDINLDYNTAIPPSKESLLAGHLARWTDVRQAWLDQAAKVEARYEAASQLLHRINVNSA